LDEQKLVKENTLKQEQQAILDAASLKEEIQNFWKELSILKHRIRLTGPIQQQRLKLLKSRRWSVNTGSLFESNRNYSREKNGTSRPPGMMGIFYK
jgi:hypothetical protein